MLKNVLNVSATSSKQDFHNEQAVELLLFEYLIFSLK